MRLLTHNLLSCNRKQCSGGFPFRVVLKEDTEEAPATKTEPSEVNPEFIKAMLQKIEWSALVETAKSVGLDMLPPSYDVSDLYDPNFIQAVHDVLSDFHIMEADMICPKCARKFPINKGIPNMLLHGDEL